MRRGRITRSCLVMGLAAFGHCFDLEHPAITGGLPPALGRKVGQFTRGRSAALVPWATTRLLPVQGASILQNCQEPTHRGEPKARDAVSHEFLCRVTFPPRSNCQPGC
jgi:hypothetical protein